MRMRGKVINPFIDPFIHLFIHPSMYSSSHLSIHPSTHLPPHPWLVARSQSGGCILVCIHLLIHTSAHSSIQQVINPPCVHLSLCSRRRFTHPCIHRVTRESLRLCMSPYSVGPECISRHNRAVGGHLWDQLGIVSNMCSGTRCEETLFGLVLNRQGSLTGYKSRRQGQ